MSKMSTLEHLVKEASIELDNHRSGDKTPKKDVLEDFFEEVCNFSNPSIASREFVKAYKDIQKGK